MEIIQISNNISSWDHFPNNLFAFTSLAKCLSLEAPTLSPCKLTHLLPRFYSGRLIVILANYHFSFFTWGTEKQNSSVLWQIFYILTCKTSHDIGTAHDLIPSLNSDLHKLFYQERMSSPLLGYTFLVTVIESMCLQIQEVFSLTNRQTLALWVSIVWRF